VEVPTVPKPYKVHSGSYELGVNVQYHNIESLYKSIYKLYELFKAKSSFHYEQELDKTFLYMHDFVSTSTFDKTRIKSLNEKS